MPSMKQSSSGLAASTWTRDHKLEQPTAQRDAAVPWRAAPIFLQFPYWAVFCPPINKMVFHPRDLKLHTRHIQTLGAKTMHGSCCYICTVLGTSNSLENLIASHEWISLINYYSSNMHWVEQICDRRKRSLTILRDEAWKCLRKTVHLNFWGFPEASMR